MAEVSPFRGIRYSTSIVRDISRVVCPPYDIISPPEAEVLRHRSPYNAVNLELADERPGDTPQDNRHTRAAALFRRWLEQQVLLREPSPAMYLLDEEFTFQGSTRRRRGLMAVVRLEEFEKGIVMPHEYTRPGPKADSQAQMNLANANFSPIMSLYRDADNAIGGLLEGARPRRPTLSAQPEGLPRYKLWTITDPQLFSEMGERFATRKIFVADGHHRYETALRYRDELGASKSLLSSDAAARYIMMTLIPMDDPGLLVLPYHRLLGGLKDNDLASLKCGLERVFKVDALEVPTTPAETMARAVQDRLAAHSPQEVVMAALGLEPGEAHLLTLRESYRPAGDGPSLERCDMWVLHQEVIGPALGAEAEQASVSFVHDAAEAVEQVQSGEKQVAFLLRSLPMDLFEEVVGKGERLPPKSTYFYPKLPTGLIINSLEGEL
ncbi:MAG: DUF1015 domain-containing protein [Dehalococcoidia bacterium]